MIAERLQAGAIMAGRERRSRRGIRRRRCIVATTVGIRRRGIKIGQHWTDLEAKRQQ